jgi:hypothetical protein
MAMAININEAISIKRFINGYMILSLKFTAKLQSTFLSYKTQYTENGICITTNHILAQTIHFLKCLTSSSVLLENKSLNTIINHKTKIALNITTLMSLAMLNIRFLIQASQVCHN